MSDHLPVPVEVRQDMLPGMSAAVDAALDRSEQIAGEYTAVRFKEREPGLYQNVVNLLRSGTAVRRIKAIFKDLGRPIHHKTIQAIREANFSPAELNEILLAKQRRIADMSADEIADTLEEVESLPLSDRVKILDKLGVVHGIASDKVQGAGTLLIEVRDTRPIADNRAVLDAAKQLAEQANRKRIINVTPEATGS